MGYWPKKVKRRRAHWVNNIGIKLVLLGATGSHSHIWPNSPRRRRKQFYIEIGSEGSEQGHSEGATLLKLAKRMELY